MTNGKEYMRNYMKKRRQNDPEKVRKENRDRRAEHPEKERERDATRHRRNPVNMMFNNARRSAKKAGVPFGIQKSDIVIPEHCPILGIKLEVGGGRSSPSLDKIIPKLGYVPGNIQVISYKANTMKNDASLEEVVLLGEWAKRTLCQN